MKSGFKIGSATIGIVGLVGLLFYFLHLNSQIKTLTEERDGAYWLLVAKEAENDSIKGIGQYSDTVTVWRTKIVAITDTIPGQVDTLYEDIPIISGSISIDTTKEFGHGSNPLKVRVYGKFYYPEEFSHKNRLLIHPVIGSPPDRPVTRSQKSVGIGLNYLRSFSRANSSDYFGGFMRYKRLSFNFGYDPWRKSLISGISIELLTF